MAAARGARRVGARRAPPAVRDQRAHLVLPPLPHDAAEGRPARGLPRPRLLAARLRRAHRRDEGALRRRRGDRDRRGLVPRAVRHRPGRGRGRAPDRARRRRRGRRIGARRRARRGARARAQRRIPTERPVRRRRGALPRVPARPGRRAGLRRDHRDAEGLRPARHGRRRVPDRGEVGDRRLAGARAQVHDLQRGRVRAGHLQGSSDPRRAAAPRARGHDARDARDRLGGGLGLHPSRVRPRGGGAARGDRRAARAGAARR